MKIVVDDKIPYIQEPLRTLTSELLIKAGKDITPEDVHDADILLIRTRTRCDRRLLEGSSVKLIVTATIGFDHLDTTYLDEAGIRWANCPGCNATSVAQYIRSCLLLLKHERDMDFSQMTLGIIGIGHVGTAVLTAVQNLGFKAILLNDPPRATAGDTAPEGFAWSSLDELTSRCDILTLHTPLITTPPYPTYHLFDAHRLQSMRRGSVLINAGRGEVADNEALEHALDTGQLADAIIDTWENEPHIRRSLLEKVYIGTPHIAGYSADGKANATRMTLEQICRFLGQPMTFHIKPPQLPDRIIPESNPERRALQLFDPRRDSDALKTHPENFEALRGRYPLRRESF